jgi:ribonuclease HI
MNVLVHIDGGSRPKNPGHAAFAFVMEAGGEKYILSRYLGIRTNNYAEHHGCLVAIKHAHEIGGTSLTIVTDSQLVKNHIYGIYRINSDSLRPIVYESRQKLKKYFPDAWTIEWVRRSKNLVADDYCTKAIWFGMNQNPFVPQEIKDLRPGEVHEPFAYSATTTNGRVDMTARKRTRKGAL